VVLKTEGVRRGSRYKEQETGRWRYKTIEHGDNGNGLQ